MKTRIGAVELECVQADIINQPDMAVIVNAANAQLQTGGGVAGAIHRAAGPGLAAECAPMAPIAPGEAVISSGHDLPNGHVIHCLGPVYGRDEPADRLLADCYRNALDLAEDHGLDSIAFPAISAGAFGYPLEAAADIALRTVAERAQGLQAVKRIRFCLFSADAERVHADILRSLAG